MYQNKKILAIIPARGNSKGVLRKNIRTVGGKPLIAWTLLEAQKSQYIDRLILSSDDEEIIEVGKAWGGEVPFVRPSKLAQDHSTGMSYVLHALEQLPGYDYMLLLQPTSPLRSYDDIDRCLEFCLGEERKICVSVMEAAKHPNWMYQLDENQQMVPCSTGERILSRQQLPKVYSLNGAIYLAEIEWLQQHQTFLAPETSAFLMPQERSLDIDTEWDLKICDLLLSSSNP